MEKIIIKDAFENNLKHLDLKIPLDKFTCVTGCSGCGKSLRIVGVNIRYVKSPPP